MTPSGCILVGQDNVNASDVRVSCLAGCRKCKYYDNYDEIDCTHTETTIENQNLWDDTVDRKPDISDC